MEDIESVELCKGVSMTSGELSAEDVKKLLGLKPHPCEGGWYVRTYEAPELVAAVAFVDGRYAGARRTGTAIYYLLEPDTFSEMHRLKSDEVFHFYAGDAVEMLQLREGAGGTMVVIGNDLVRGQRPQVVVERGVWQGSRLVQGGKWALLGCTVSPGFEFDDYETGSREELSARWPEFATEIAALTRRVR
jgi:predicted cupin superfamily sugar epimerase